MLQTLPQHDDIIFTNFDKKIGFVIIECGKYFLVELEKHLSDKVTYKRLTPDEWICNTEKIRYKTSGMISKNRGEPKKK